MIKPASLRSDFRPDTPEWLSGMPRNHCPACAGIGVRNHRNTQENLEDVPESVINLLHMSRSGYEMFTDIQKRLLKVLRNNEQIKERVD